MNLVWHIAKRDLLALRWYLAVLAVAAVFLGYLQGQPPEAPNGPGFTLSYSIGAAQLLAISLVLLPAAWLLVAVMLVQLDRPQGDTEDWLTRPIGWRRLLAAKLLGLCLLALLPALADLVTLAVSGAEPAQWWDGLLFRHLLRILLLLLPTAAVAAVTKGVAQAIAGTVGLLLFSILVGQIPLGLTYALWMHWTHVLFSYLFCASLALALLVFQYRKRWTWATIVLLPLAGWAAILTPGLPWPGDTAPAPPLAPANWVLRDTLAPKHRFEDLSPRGLRLEFDPAAWRQPSAGVHDAGPLRSLRSIAIPVKLTGAETGMVFETASLLRLQFLEQTPAGLSKRLELDARLSATGPAAHRQLWITASLDSGQMQSIAGRHIVLQARVGLTVARQGPALRLAFTEPWQRFEGIGDCIASDRFGQISIRCRSPYRQRYAYAADIYVANTPQPLATLYKDRRDSETPLPATLFAIDPLQTLDLSYTSKNAYLGPDQGPSHFVLRRLDEFRNAQVELRTEPLEIPASGGRP